MSKRINNNQVLRLLLLALYSAVPRYQKTSFCQIVAVWLMAPIFLLEKETIKWDYILPS
jgi:hypothetical protein